MILGILLSFGTGTGASWEVYRIGNLAKLGQEWPESKPFHKLSRIWLFSSSIVDACLAVVLCWELWWAREKLTAKDDHEGGLGVLNKGKGSNGILLRLIVSLLPLSLYCVDANGTRKGHHPTWWNRSHSHSDLSSGIDVHRHVDFWFFRLYALYLCESFLSCVPSPPRAT
jgi:hypothetical protein